MSRNVRKRIFWHMRPTKTQITLCIRTVWSESSLLASRNFLQTSLYKMRPVKIMIKLRDCADWPYLRWANMSRDTFSDVAAQIPSNKKTKQTKTEQQKLHIQAEIRASMDLALRRCTAFQKFCFLLLLFIYLFIYLLILYLFVCLF